MIGANGANYMAMEFSGEGLKTLNISDRIAICNLCVEAGAKTALMEVDDITLDYLKAHSREPKHISRVMKMLCLQRFIILILQRSSRLWQSRTLSIMWSAQRSVWGRILMKAFLGSCNNGRIEDLRVGAELIKGKKVHPLVRFLVVPASAAVYQQALSEGIISTFMDAGAIVMNPNCSVCWGSCQGVIGENEVLISTGTRNFKGRAGHKDSFVYLASAATVTASAIKGEIATADMV